MKSLGQIIEQGPFIIYKFKDKGKWEIESITNNCEGIIGYTDSELIENKPTYLDIIYCDDKNQFIDELKEFINNPGNHYHKPYRIANKNGAIIWVNDYKIIEQNETDESKIITAYLTILPNYEELNKNEKLYRLLAEHSTDLISSHSPDAVFQYASPSCKEMLGYEVNDLIGHSSFEFIHPEDIAIVENSKSSIINNEITSTIEYRFRCKNGLYIWLETISQAILDKNSRKIIEIHATTRNINDKKLAQIALQESKANIQAIIENTTDSIWAINLRYEIIYINEVFKNAFKNSFGVTLSVGMNLVEAIPENIRGLWKSRYDRAFKNEQFVFEDKIDLPGFTIYIEVAMNPIVAEGQVIGASFFSRDITGRRQIEQKLIESEEKLTTLFEAMTEMVVLHDVVFDDNGEAINYRITDCNKSYTEITGVKKEDAIGKLATEVYQSDSPPYLKEFTQVGITGNPFEYITYYEPMDKHFIISVVCPQRGKFATITTDITAIKHIEEIVSSKNKELENYLYVASHDLRSPLVNIQGFSNRIIKQIQSIKKIIDEHNLKNEEIEKISNIEIPRTIEFIFANVIKMDKLINGLLQISRTGRMKMTIQQVDVNQLFEKLLKSYSFQLDEINGKVHVENLPNCYGDPDLLNQLFSNLIENAIKYRKKDIPLVLKITGRTSFKRSLYSIQDNGLGIAERHKEKIWNVFYRVNPQGEITGDGIGLSIVKRIVDKHKGNIRLESTESIGSTFHIDLNNSEFKE